jgi:hypothetical protein
MNYDSGKSVAMVRMQFKTFAEAIRSFDVVKNFLIHRVLRATS